MKKLICLLILIPFLLSKTCFGDVIVTDIHYVEICAKITNIDDYPEISLLGFTPGPTKYNTYIISSSECLSKGYAGNFFNIYAVNKKYLEGKDIQKLDFFNDVNVIKSNIQIDNFGTYVRDTTHIYAIDQFYKIVGFSSTSVILYKWKEVTRFHYDDPDSTSTYTFDGDISKLYQNIQVGIHSNQYQTSIELYPNPAQKNFHLKINNLYQGSVPVEMVTMDGKIVKSLTLSKNGSVLDYDIRVENLDKGAYFVRIIFGEKVEFKKIVIK